MDGFKSTQDFKTLREFESFYQILKPAQVNNSETFIWFSEIPHPLFNAVMHYSSSLHQNKKIETLIQEMQKTIPITFWMHPQNKMEKNFTDFLIQSGFQSIITCPLMSLSVKSQLHLPFDIRPAQMDIFNDLLANNFQFDKNVKESFGKLLESSSMYNYLIYIHGMPIGTGTLVPNKKIGGIFNISVLPEFQKKGYGKAITQFLIQKAYDLEIQKLILLSSPQAEKIYSDLGFKKVFDVQIYAQIKQELEQSTTSI